MNADRTRPLRPVTDLRIRQVLIVMEQEPWQRTSCLAAFVRLAPTSLQHLFSKEVGVNIGEYSRELRLQHARLLLATTWKSIKEVRNAVGIPNGPNFVRYFRKRFGMTPSVYQKTF